VSAIAQRVADDLAERLERQIADLTLVIETTQHAIRELELELENRQRIIAQQQARIDAYLRPAKDAPWRRLERYAVDALMEAHTLRNAHRKDARPGGALPGASALRGGAGRRPERAQPHR
jgi:septal ring factor EnvC (AmiA/AmiB activator)